VGRSCSACAHSACSASSSLRAAHCGWCCAGAAATESVAPPYIPAGGLPFEQRENHAMTAPWIRRTAIGFGVVLVLLVIGAAVLIATFDANRFKGLAIDYMKNERQRTLVIDGPIELSVFPRLAVKVSKVKLSEHKRPDEFLAIGEAALAVQTWPLLRKQLVVDRVSARGVRAVYSRDA
jgi:hypothetical protein